MTSYADLIQRKQQELQEAIESGAQAAPGQSIHNFDYTMVDAYPTIKLLGEWILAAGLLLWLIHEFYKLMREGQADFLTPILKIGMVVLVLEGIGFFSQAFSVSIGFLADEVFDHNVHKTAALAYAVAFNFVADPGLLDYVNAFFDPVAWICLLTYINLLAVGVVKIALFDVLWPVLMALVTVLGTIAIPLGMIPGLKTIRGWFLQMAELALWPIVFQLSTTLLFGFFAGNLQELPGIRDHWHDLSDIREELDDAQEERSLIRTLSRNQADTSELDARIDELKRQVLSQERSNQGKLFVLLKYLALNTAFLVLCIAVPMISRTVIRGESIGEIGNMVGNAVTRSMQTVVLASAMRMSSMSKTSGRAVGKTVGMAGKYGKNKWKKLTGRPTAKGGKDEDG